MAETLATRCDVCIAYQAGFWDVRRFIRELWLIIHDTIKFKGRVNYIFHP